MNEQKSDEFLIHHGVKGMKWGVRRTQAQLDRAANRRASRSPSDDSRRASTLRKKPMRALSNKELKDVNERLNLEQNYSRLNPSSITKGKNFAKATIATAGAAAGLYNLVKSPAGKAAIEVGRKAVKPLVIANRARRAFG